MTALFILLGGSGQFTTRIEAPHDHLTFDRIESNGEARIVTPKAADYCRNCEPAGASCGIEGHGGAARHLLIPTM